MQIGKYFRHDPGNILINNVSFVITQNSSYFVIRVSNNADTVEIATAGYNARIRVFAIFLSVYIDELLVYIRTFADIIFFF